MCAATINRIGFLQTRIGAALRKGMRTLFENGEESGRSVSPHVRRAHHHPYYCIELKTKQERVLKWLSPILKNKLLSSRI
jgi:hypothetical protein